MKRVVLVLTFALFVTGLMLPSVLCAESRVWSGMTKHPAFTDQKAPVRENSSLVSTKKSTDGWRITIERLLTVLRWPAIGIVITDTPSTKADEPFFLQDPPWERPPLKHRPPDKDDHGAGVIWP